MERSKNKQDMINILMPLGMMAGCTIGSIVGMFLDSGFLVYAITIGSGVGYIVGLIAYLLSLKMK